MNAKNKKVKKDSVGIIVGSGAMNDDKIEGLAHFTEHMLFLVKKLEKIFKEILRILKKFIYFTFIYTFREVKNIQMKLSSMTI